MEHDREGRGGTTARITEVALSYTDWSQREICFHITDKRGFSVVVWEPPHDLEKEIQSFIDPYNSKKHHEALGNAPPDDIYHDRKEDILNRRSRLKHTTIAKKESLT